MSLKTRYLVWLILLAIFDILIPIPLVAAFLIYVVAIRPPWFPHLVRRLYQQET